MVCTYPIVHLICRPVSGYFYIFSSSSHSSLVINSLELLCLGATLCLYETRVTRVVCSCAVDVKVTSSKTSNDTPLYYRKFNLSLTFLTCSSTKILSWGMLLAIWTVSFIKGGCYYHGYKSYVFHPESSAKWNIFNESIYRMRNTALHHKYSLVVPIYWPPNWMHYGKCKDGLNNKLCMVTLFQSILYEDRT